MWIQEEERRAEAGLGDEEGIQLGLAEYEQLGAGKPADGGVVKNALSRHGDRILERMAPEERKVAEVMFRRLVEVEERSSRLRRPTRCGTVARLAQVPLDVVQRVVDAFRADDASFIYASRPRVTDDTSIDIMHESLIRQWDTLDSWVRREKASYEVYNELCRAAQHMQEGRRGRLSGLELSRAVLWASLEQPTPLWARRYGGDFDAAINFLKESQEAEKQRLNQEREAEKKARRQEEERLRLENERLRLEHEQSRLRAEKSLLAQDILRTRLEEQTKLAQERRRFTRLAVAAAVVLGLFALLATRGFLYALDQKVRADAAAELALAEAKRADEAVIETKAASFWSRLQLWGDPLRPEDVVTLWELTQEDDNVRVALVRQLADDHGLVDRFGFKPQPIARAIGLRWPDEARQIAGQSLAHVASNGFDPTNAGPFALVAYTGALAALQQWLDRATFDAATRNIARAINGLAGAEQLSDQQLWVLAEAVGVFGARIDPAAIEPARSKLRRILVKEAPNANAGWRGQAISRAIELMAPDLTAEERLQAVRTLAPLLGRNTDSSLAKAIPRAMVALLPRLDVGQATEMLK
ncbi:MAG: hypothetical protein ACREJ0_15735, partial [Geminicoccaceae bacterium]